MPGDLDVGRWLLELGLAEYTEAFRDHQIDGEILVELTDADLKEIGVVALGARKKLLAAIRKMALEPPARSNVGATAEVSPAVPVEPPSAPVAPAAKIVQAETELTTKPVQTDAPVAAVE